MRAMHLFGCHIECTGSGDAGHDVIALIAPNVQLGTTLLFCDLRQVIQLS